MPYQNGNLPKGLTLFPPLLVRKLAGDDLPFNELDEIILALTIAEELEEDVLGVFNDMVTGGPPFDQWQAAVAIRQHYLERLRTLAQRIENGERGAIVHVANG